jgi:hypothetical protein
VASCILGNVDQGRICATDVARWDTSFGIAIGSKRMVLVHLEGMMAGHGLSVTTKVVKAYEFALFCS